MDSLMNLGVRLREAREKAEHGRKEVIIAQCILEETFAAVRKKVGSDDAFLTWLRDNKFYDKWVDFSKRKVRL